MLSAMFSHDPPSGVYNGMMPCKNSQQTNAAVLCPARLSSTSSIRSGGNSEGSVGLTVRPSCQRSQARRAAPPPPPARGGGPRGPPPAGGTPPPPRGGAPGGGGGPAP